MFFSEVIFAIWCIYNVKGLVNFYIFLKNKGSYWSFRMFSLNLLNSVIKILVIKVKGLEPVTQPPLATTKMLPQYQQDKCERQDL